MDKQELNSMMRGIGLRAAVLAVGGVVIGGWFVGTAMKAAGAALKTGVALSLIGVGGAMAAWEVNKVRRRLTQHETPDRLQTSDSLQTPDARWQTAEAGR